VTASQGHDAHGKLGLNSTIKNVAFWLVILLSGVLLWKVVQADGAGTNEQEIVFSRFMQEVDEGHVSDVVLSGTEVHGKYKNSTAGFHSAVPMNYPRMIDELRDKGVNITVKDSSGNGWPSYLLNLSPLVLFAALWFVMVRQLRTPRK
jgi:cell division protease FtsH